MKIIIIFSISVLIFSSFAERPTTCGHKYLEKNRRFKKPDRVLTTITNYFANATIKAEKDRIAAGQPGQFSNIRITFDYQFFNTSLLNATKYAFFQNALLSSLQNYYQSTITLFPRQKTIYPPSTICGDATLVVNQNNLLYGYNNTDVLIFVTGLYDSTQDYIAWTEKCETDPDLFDRPLIGLVNCNFYYLDWDLTGFDESFKTLAHEMFHFFVFRSDSYSYYVSEDGVTLGLDNVVQADNTSTLRYKLILSQTTAFGAQFFGCSNLDGIWLEDLDADSNSLGSHWEDTYFRDELMSPIDRPNKKMSNFSFNLLGSVGWYIVNYDNIQDYYFGYQDGCNFEALGCKNVPLFPEYCSTKNTIGCQEDYSGVGFCNDNQFSDNDCLTEDSDTTVVCFNNNNSDFLQDVANKGGSVSPNSYCFPSTLIQTEYRYPASCYVAQCNKNPATQTYTIDVTIANTTNTCSSDYQLLTVSGYEGNLTCPNISRFCKYYESYCRNGCNSGMGVCSTGGICHFYKGEGICSENCSSCLNSSYCLVCEPGIFRINSGVGLASCSTTGCLFNEYLDQTTMKCMNCDPSCLTCSGNGASNCSSCSAQSYFYQQQCSACMNVDPNCASCSAAANGGTFTCTQCNPNFFVNSSSLCAGCSILCLTCNGSTSSDCNSCFDGRFLNQSTNTCDLCSENCPTCAGPNSDDCLSCLTGLTIVDGQCKNTSQIDITDITSTKTLGGLGNLTSNLNDSTNDSNVLNKYTQYIISKVIQLTSSNSSNLTDNDLSSVGGILQNLLNFSGSNNNSWNSSFTSQAILIIMNVSSSFTNLALSTGSLNVLTTNSFMSSLSQLVNLNSNTNDTLTQKTNEQNILKAAETIIDSNIYFLNNSNTSISYSSNLCNFQIAAILSDNTMDQTLSVTSISQNTDGPSVVISQSFLSSISNGTTYVKLVEWANNPYTYSDSSNTSNLSSVVSIDFYAASQAGFFGLNVNNLSQNKSFGLPKVRGNSINSSYYYSCVYWNENSFGWDNTGMSTTQPQNSDGTVVCSSNHFSDFAYTLVLNTINQNQSNTSGNVNNTSGNVNNTTGNFNMIIRIYWVFSFISIILMCF